MSRYQASFYHFLISAVVFLFPAYLVLFQWYPDFFFKIDGGWEGMRIIIGVHLALGPLLTLIVFKAGKPGLKTDLTVIGLFQSICLIAGISVVYNERPLYFIFYDDHFYSANKGTFERYGQNAPEVTTQNAGVPAMIYIKLPENLIEEAGVRSILYKDGIPLWIYEPFFTPLGSNLDRLTELGFNEEELLSMDENGKIPPWLAKYGGKLSDYAFFPIHSRYRDAFLGLRKSDTSIVDILEVQPPH